MTHDDPIFPPVVDDRMKGAVFCQLHLLPRESTTVRCTEPNFCMSTMPFRRHFVATKMLRKAWDMERKKKQDSRNQQKSM